MLDPLGRAADEDGIADPAPAGCHHDEPGVVLFLIEYAAGSRNRPKGTRRGDPEVTHRTEA